MTLSIGGWDTHSSNFKTLKKQLPNVDRGIANLIQDLHDRGMARRRRDGDVGRVRPHAEDQQQTTAAAITGRRSCRALVAGGGLKMGQAVGVDDARGEHPKDRPYTVPQVLSTLYQAIGIDPSQTFPNGSGRPMYILDDREPVTELL